jgi:hypothetical protein
VIAFDPDDRRAASWELLVGSGTACGRPSSWAARFLDRDLERFRSLLPAGSAFTITARYAPAARRDDYTPSRRLFEESPDAIIEPLYYLTIEPHGTLAVAHTLGTNRSGGAFENVFVQVVVPSSCAELFELDDLELARARFEELRPDPMRIPPNAASRARDRSFEAWEARDWDALRALARPDFVFEDRSKRALVTGGLEMWLENNRFLQGGSFERERIATAGDRIVLDRALMKNAPDGSPVSRFLG